MPDHLKRRPTVGERAAALASLLALAAAVVLLLIGVVLHLAAVLLTIVGAGVFVTAGWYAVSRRGTVRAAARALRVRLPRHAVKPSPAARTVHLLSGSTITELARVLVGR